MYYGTAFMQFQVNADVFVPIFVYSASEDVWIRDLHIPLATDDSYITERYTDGILHYPLSEWYDASFLAPETNDSIPYNFTSQPLLGWADLGGGPNPWLHPTTGPMIAEFKMHTRYLPSLIGDTIDGIFAPGWNQQSHYIHFGDTLGQNDYTE